MTTMHNPPHPGQFIKDTYLDPLNISMREVAENLGVSPSTLNRLIKGKSNISPAMAFRLAKTLGRTPESWLAMQAQYDLWITKRNINLKNVHKLNRLNYATALVKKNSHKVNLEFQAHSRMKSIE